MYLKTKIFADEIDLIRNKRIKEFAKYAVSNLPDYFFEIPASSTGKYHPKYALNEGGLVRHTKAAVRIAYDLFCNIEEYADLFSDNEKDCIITALICHDGFKSGITKNKYTSFDHPLIAASKIREWGTVWKPDSECDISSEIELIASLIEPHMGKWNKVNYSSAVLPKPSDPLQYFVHQCDYLASRKYLNCEFEDYYNPCDYKDEALLQNSIDEFIEYCRKIIADGADRDAIYSTITKLNNGKRNPKLIPSMDVLQAIKQEVVTLER